MDRKLLLILNPTSGRGAAAGSLFSIVNGFSKTGWEVTVIPTQEKGDAQKIARERAADFPFLVCCGGDGTLNETVNGLMEVQDRFWDTSRRARRTISPQRSESRTIRSRPRWRSAAASRSAATWAI